MTGGADGLSGASIGTLLGAFKWDLHGQDGYAGTHWPCCCGHLVAALPDHLSGRSCGAALDSRENRVRMHAIGAPVSLCTCWPHSPCPRRSPDSRGTVYADQSFVAIEVLGFERSARVLAMLILGGVGRVCPARRVHRRAGRHRRGRIVWPSTVSRTTGTSASG